MKNAFADKIRAGKRPLGTFIESGSAGIVEAVAYAGMDYVVLDCEHGTLETFQVESLVRAAKLAGITPLVRVKDSERNSILRALDAGAMGLIIPNVQCADEAREIVRHGKYFPLGDRGAAPAAGTAWWTKDYATQGLEHNFEVSNRETLLIPQCETAGALAEIEDIASMNGIDGVFVGPLDMSIALGKPGNYEDQAHVDACQRVVEACAAASKFSMIYSGTIQDAKFRYDQGFSSVSYGMDSLIVMNAVKEVVASLG